VPSPPKENLGSGCAPALATGKTGSQEPGGQPATAQLIDNPIRAMVGTMSPCGTSLLPISAGHLVAAMEGLAVLGPVAEHWAKIAGVLLVLLALLVATWFYRRLALRLHHAEREIQGLLESAPFAIAVTQRTSGRLLFANRRAITVLGLPPAGYASLCIPYADGAVAREKLLARLAREGAVLDKEMELLGYDGRRFPVLGSVVPIAYAGQPALIGAFQDISDLKATELKVRSSEMRLRALFETVPDGIVVLDREGHVRQASESCATLLGLANLDAQHGRAVIDFVAEEDRPRARELLDRLIAGHPNEPTAFRIQRSDDSALWVEPRGVNLTDPVTNQPFTILVLRNITKRREAQEQLAEQVVKLKDALDRIAHLQNAIVSVCAWTKRVKIDGRWIPIDHYLAQYLGLKISHGISEEGLAMLGVPPEPEAPKPGTTEMQP